MQRGSDTQAVRQKPKEKINGAGAEKIKPVAIERIAPPMASPISE